MPRRLSYLPAVLLLCLTACATQPQGSSTLAATVQQALSASDITRVTVTISASDMAPMVVDLAKSNGVWGGLVGNIPAGLNRSFVADAFDSSGTKRFQGQTTGVTITANQTVAVALTLQELSPQPPYSNEAPLIDSLVASTTAVQVGASVSLTATAHDPNPADTLTYAWSATGGTFSAPTAANSTWTAPATLGIQTLTLTVTDSQGAAVSVSVAINVYSGATGNAAINISFNLWPVVSKVSASLNRLNAGQSTSVTTTASDADGDTLSYLWSSSCPGTWTNATSSSAAFVPSSVPASVCNNCQLTVAVRDGRGGQTTGSLNLCITSSSTQRFPPAFTSYFQSAVSVSAGQTVTFNVNALDPQSSSMTFAWSTNMGSLASVQNTANTTHVEWTAPACAGATSTVTVVVTNAYGLSASLPFSLSGLPSCAASGWSAAASMATPRTNPSSILLPSGKVLVAAGFNGSALFSAEVYDPATSSWSSTGSMASPHDSAPAILLPSGKVLVPGGAISASGATAIAELYDPATNSWSSAGSMAAARFGHTATRLASGKVLITGGFNGGFLSSTELYNPATNSWSSAAPMSSVRYLHSATLLPSGKVLAVGGYGAGFFSSAEVYDPATNTWSSAASMAGARYAHVAILMPSGKVFVVGGQYNFFSSHLATAELYDPAANTWSSAGSLAVERSGHAAILLSSGKVLVAAGVDNAGTILTSAQLYDPAINSWSSTASLAVARAAPGAILMTSGKVLVAGGTGTGSTYLSSAELYTP